MANRRPVLDTSPPQPEALVAAVLAEEQRREGQEGPSPDSSSAELLAGVGGDGMSLREVAKAGGLGTLGVLCSLPLIDALQGSTFGVLAPDIQKTLHLSLEKVGIIGSLGALTVLIAALPLGRLGDSYRRFPIVGACTLVVAVFTLLSGLAHATWQLVVATTLAGMGKGNEGPVQGSLVADAFPIEGRNRAFALIRGAQGFGFLIGPALVGGIASLAGGAQGWRWPFLILAIPPTVVGLAAFGVREPRRGRQEMHAILGEELEVEGDALPVPLRAGFSRLKKIRSFNYFIMAVAVLGFNLIAVPIYTGIYLQHRFGLGAGARGVVGSLAAVGTFVGVAIGGAFGDRLFRRSPASAAQVAALALVGSGAFYALAFLMPNPPLYTLFAAFSGACTMGGFVTLQGTVAAVMPYRLRATGMAMIFLYLSLFGGLLGAVLVAQLESATSLQVALAAISVAAAIVGAGFLGYGSRFVESDMQSASADLLEERDEIRRASSGAEIPLLQVRNLDFSYGAVQVLFGVNLDVWEGEVLALLGTNGAGKSTVLRAVTGLSPGDRGVVRLAGKTITLADPSVRLAQGIVQVPGGKATFPSMSVLDNLRARGYSVRRKDLNDRIDKVLDQFPVLRSRLDQPAGTLSGGEQQMLAIAGALLLDPKLLLIDELSLGLAPIMVQQLLEVIRSLKSEGLTMVIVEQSVNVALSLADRAVFMEKGQVRFEGSAKELLERDDLVRAVFLGAEGG